MRFVVSLGTARTTPQPASAGTPVTIGDFSFAYNIYP